MNTPKGSTISRKASPRGKYNVVDPGYTGSVDGIDFSTWSCKALEQWIAEYEQTNTLLPRTQQEIIDYNNAKYMYGQKCMGGVGHVDVSDINMMNCSELGDYIRYYEQSGIYSKNQNEQTRYEYAKSRHGAECPVMMSPSDLGLNGNTGIGNSPTGGGSGGGGGSEKKKKFPWWLLVVGIGVLGYLVSGKKSGGATAS